MTAEEFQLKLKSGEIKYKNGKFSEKKGNKFGAKKTEYKGVKYDSKREAAYATELDLRKKADEIKSWTRQHKIELTSEGKHVTNYFIDFKVVYPDDSIEYVEVKGFETALWKTKWKMALAYMEKHEPESKMIIVK